MIYSSIYRDTYYTTTADSLNYKIELDGNIIYYGRAVKFPDADTMKININKVCRDYLSSNIDLILNGASAQTNTTALRVFTLTNTLTNQVLEQYTFLYDWNYVELWTGQTQNRYYKDGDTPVSNYITVTPASLNNIPSTGGSFTITVNSNVPWRTNSTGVYPSTGNAGSTTVTISIGENPYDTRYSGSKTFYMVGDTSVQATFRYFQDAASTTGTTISIYPTELLHIPASGGTYSVTVYSDANWNTSVPSWVTVSPQAGTGNATVTVQIEPNEYVSRSAAVTFHTDGDDASLLLLQDEAEDTPTVVVFVSPSEITNVPSTGNTYTITVLSSGNWVVNVPSWMTASKTGGTQNDTFTVTVPNNTGDTRTGNIVVSSIDDSKTIPLTQNAASSTGTTVDVYPTTLNDAGSGGTTYTIDIISNGDWTVTVPSWMTVTPASGSGNGSITVTVLPNTGDRRIGNIVVATADDSKTLGVWQNAGSSSESGHTDEYLTIEFVSGGTINFAAPSSADSLTMYYKKNDGNWTEITSTNGSVEKLSGNTGDKIYLKGYDYFEAYLQSSSSYGIIYNNFDSSDNRTRVKLYGNIMSTIYGDDFSGRTTLPNSFAFCKCFGHLGVCDASGLVLPATALTEYCYYGMFLNCSYLEKAPALPATQLANACYYSMFSNCVNLTIAPQLPATTLASGCYEYMFARCWSLPQAPQLPATTLVPYCYLGMFKECTALTTAPTLPATTLADFCYQAMFQKCTSLTTAPALPATTLATNCYSMMFEECTALTTAPDLNATTLVDYSYSKMFNGCSNLNYIKCLATNISANGCTWDWVGDVQTNSGTFVRNRNMTDWTIGTSGIPSNWTIQNN